MTPITDMIEEMLAKNTPVDVILVAVRAIELSRTSVPDIRDYERTRKQAWRSKTKAEPKANDVGTVSDMSRTVPDNRCDLSSLLSKSVSGIQEVKEEKKQTEIVALAQKKVSRETRGTRMVSNAALTDAERQFARDQGMEVAAIDKAWAEFKDYWISIPGQRGTKLDWSATWRNRVRQISSRVGGRNGYGGPRPLQDDSKSASRAASKLAELAERGEFKFAPRPSLLPQEGGDAVVMLPARRSTQS